MAKRNVGVRESIISIVTTHDQETVDMLQNFALNLYYKVSDMAEKNRMPPLKAFEKIIAEIETATVNRSDNITRKRSLLKKEELDR